MNVSGPFDLVPPWPADFDPLAQDSRKYVTVLTGKGDLTNMDVLVPEVLQELLPLYKQFDNISVTTSKGNEYGTKDLCSSSGGRHADSCMVISPFQCFSEHLGEGRDPFSDMSREELKFRLS